MRPTVGIYPADGEGCGFYRMLEPARVLADHPDVEVVYPAPILQVGWSAAWEPLWEGGGPPAGVEPLAVLTEDLPDLIVLQRPLRHDLALLVPLLQAAGSAVAVEVDDDFDSVPVLNRAWPGVQPETSPGRNREWLHYACDAADAVFCTTPALARRYGEAKAFVLPNLVPAWYLEEPKPPADGVTVGWSGSVATHPGDLEVLGGAVGPALRAESARWLTVGTGAGVPERLRYPVTDATGWLPLPDYPAALARLDVGVVPLASHDFNRAKSWLKGLEMAAVGAVPIVSPTPDYVRLAAEGLCVTASGRGRWSTLLRRWAADTERAADARAGFVEAARGRIRASWTYEARAGDLWPAAWRGALELAAARRRVPA